MKTVDECRLFMVLNFTVYPRYQHPSVGASVAVSLNQHQAASRVWHVW